MDRGSLTTLLAPVRLPNDPRVLVGTATSDDAGVVALSKDVALVQTVDFFPPMVDDPAWFGRITAANSLSDVWAMGGTPHSCTDVMAVPEGLPPWVPGEILNGAIERITEGGAVLVGGHTITDTGLKFGLAVTGTIHPDRIVTNAGARVGDVLVLTKPLGSGFLAMAIKREDVADEEALAVMEIMATLNRAAGEAMVEAGATACTDVTGYGVLGHACGMADGAGLSMRIRARDLPRIPGLERHMHKKNVCGGLKRNTAWGETRVRYGPDVTEEDRMVFADPQTSGGLLIAIPAARLERLLEGLKRRGVATRAVVGEVLPRGETALELV
ncbi:MAG TPA: selenide, water dikinase SelD [Planctomycetota bacterium]|nr:selenide, water dikinase SelD [Planctomycetota bacterium]